MMSPKIVDKKAKKQDILEAAMRVFARKGVAKTKMADVAEAAGIGKGTVYEYFNSKEDIFTESFRYFMLQVETVIARRLLKIYDPLEKLDAIIDGWVEAMQQSPTAFPAIMMDFWAEGVRHKENTAAFDLKEMYDKSREMMVRIIEEGIAKGIILPVNSTIAASILIGAMDGLMLQWIMDHNLFELNEAAEVLKKSFVEKGLKADG